jgi:hypothetical protein
VGSRAVLDAVVKRKIPSPRWKPKARTMIVQPEYGHKTGLGQKKYKENKKKDINTMSL